MREAWFAILVRLLTGVGLAGAFVGGADYVRSTLRSPVAQGFYGAVSMASAGLALALVPLWPGWRAPFATAAIVAAVGLVLVALAPAGDAAARQPVARRGCSTGACSRSVSCTRRRSGSRSCSATGSATLLERSGGESAHLAGVVGGLVLFLGVVSRPLGGRLVDRPELVRASFVVGAAGIALLTVARPPALAIAAAAIVGLAAGIPFASALSGAQQLRPDAPAAAVGIVNLAATLVILVGTPLLGLTFSLPGGGRVGFAVAAALCLAATASARKVHAVPSFR